MYNPFASKSYQTDAFLTKIYVIIFLIKRENLFSLIQNTERGTYI